MGGTANPLPAETVRALLASRFPELSIDDLRRVDEGGNHWTFAIGDLIFRFPRDRRTADKLTREVRLLALIGPALPIQVPQPVYLGGPGEDYPHLFSGHRRLDGVSGEVLRPAREWWPALAREMGAFLSALHSTSVDMARGAGIIEETLPEPSVRLADVEALLTPVMAELAAAAPAVRLWNDGPVPLPSRLPSVVSHADLKGEHMLVTADGRSIAGIIDWTDISLRDPVVDFVGLTIWLGEGFVRQVMQSYTRPVDRCFRERVRFYARCSVVEQLGLLLTGRSDAPPSLLLTQLHWAFDPVQ